MHKIEKKPWGYELTFADIMTKEEMQKWVEESKALLATAQPSFSRYRFGVPATSIITSPVGISTSAEPRSGSFKIKAKGSIINPMPFQKTYSCLNSSAGRLRKLAAARMNASLANSLG